MDRRYLQVNDCATRYGGSRAAWRRWVANGLLGQVVCRFGRLVMIDTVRLDERLDRTGQLLVRPEKPPNDERAKLPASGQKVCREAVLVDREVGLREGE